MSRRFISKRKTDKWRKGWKRVSTTLNRKKIKQKKTISINSIQYPFKSIHLEDNMLLSPYADVSICLPDSRARAEFFGDKTWTRHWIVLLANLLLRWRSPPILWTSERVSVEGGSASNPKTWKEVFLCQQKVRNKTKCFRYHSRQEYLNGWYG